MKVNPSLSTFRQVTSGVPQGLLPGPLLFAIRIIDIPSLNESIGAIFILIAHDPLACNNTRQSHQCALDKLSKWCKDNSMGVNI